MKDAVNGYLYITLKEDGETVFFFGGSTVIPKDRRVRKGIKQMQDPNTKPLCYTTGSKDVRAQFELKPILLGEFNFINRIWREDLEFDTTFVHKDGSIIYSFPRIDKQPM